jgi:peptide/nickel transport system ATP-binding protein
MTVAQQVAETYELVSRPAADTQDDSLRARTQRHGLAGAGQPGPADAADKYPFMISGGMAQRWRSWPRMRPAHRC